MFNTIKDAEKISLAQAAFEQKVRASATRSGLIALGYQGGGREVMLHFLERLNFWVGNADSGNRYWNALGIGDPFVDDHPIIAEINPPKSGIDRRISGLFCRDRNGRVHLAHRGRVGGGRKGIGKNAFLAWYPRPLDSVDDDGRRDRVIVIGALDDNSLLAELAAFTKSVAIFKNKVVSGELH